MLMELHAGGLPTSAPLTGRGWSGQAVEKMYHGVRPRAVVNITGKSAIRP
ncbi:hypothetical protein [Streptomyces sp. NBC_00091]|nr:hypothetical protein [Streptomyces sp. NBC_00091]